MFWMSGVKALLIGAGLATQRFSLETEDSVAIMLALGERGIGIIETSAANESRGSRIEIYGKMDGFVRQYFMGKEQLPAISVKSRILSHLRNFNRNLQN
jgi:hypothetical protein